MQQPSLSSPHGFAHISSTDLPEINGSAHVYQHEPSGARLLYLKNDDPNKAFCISFKTPPVDDTGVFHILEHSVLCGSQKFPVKEPFVNLLKTSMQTFLNAMTFPDKTMYPVASTNSQDLMNLMDVYLDAVLHPAIYSKPEIFLQEGWHYEMGEDDSAFINGVVFNEMKGALSDPDEVLYDAVSAALFPQTAYSKESGGTPNAIPALTYEGFLDHHARHYRLDNSYITLYGNLDPDEFFAFLDEHYLTPCANLNKQAGAPNPLLPQEPVTNHGGSVTMVTSPDNASVASGFVVGTCHDRLRLAATDILIDALAGSNEAPLKRALLDAQIANDISFSLADSVMQPFVFAQAKGLKDQGAQRFLPQLQACVQQVLDQGLDKQLIKAAISSAEFASREKNFSYSDGVIYAITSMASWLYDEDDPLSFLQYEQLYLDLKAALDTTYYEDLLRSLFLDNNHGATVTLIPVEEDPESPLAQHLRTLQESLTPERIQQINQEVDALRIAQETPDSPDDLATLPQLGLADLTDAPAEPPYAHTSQQGMNILRHSVATNGIAYAYRYYGLKHLAWEDLPAAGLLTLVLGKLATGTHTAAEIDTLTQANLGNLGFCAEVHEKLGERNNYFPCIAVSASALGDKAPWMATLVDEILLDTHYDAADKIKDLLEQKKLFMEMTFANNGNKCAVGRLGSYYLTASQVREALSGVDLYLYLRQLLAQWDSRKDALMEQLARLAKEIFTDQNCLYSFAGPDDAFEGFASNRTPAPGRDAAFYGESTLEPPVPCTYNEAFIVSSDVTFSALGCDRSQLGIPHTGPWTVASRILTYDYLWNEVRVKGGAYGVGFSVIRTGNARFTSYRDPHVDETIQRFNQAASWLKAFNPTEPELEGFLVSTVAGLDQPEKPREILRRQASWHLSGMTQETKLEHRSQVIATTLEDLHEVADGIQKMNDANRLCVFGNRDVINASKLGLKVVDLLS